MSKATRAAVGGEGKVEDLTFEAALKKLEGIVESMETEDLALETLLARYEEGKRMAQFCQGKLAEAELRIRKLEETSGGELEAVALEGPLGGGE